jgi:hypothetical protein
MTFKAVHAAFKYGFRDSKLGTSRLTTEPEACAQYTLEAAQSEGIMDIREVCVSFRGIGSTANVV